MPVGAFALGLVARWRAGCGPGRAQARGPGGALREDVVAAAIRRILARYQDSEQRPLARPAGAHPVALITPLFPLLPDTPDDTGHC